MEAEGVTLPGWGSITHWKEHSGFVFGAHQRLQMRCKRCSNGPCDASLNCGYMVGLGSFSRRAAWAEDKGG